MRPPFANSSILAITLAIAPSALAASQPALNMDGLGPLKFGMTVRQVERAIGRLDLSDAAEGPGCLEGGPKGPWVPGVGFIFVKGRLARIDISEGPTKSEAGVGVGSTVAEVKRAYGKRLQIELRPYFDEEDGEHDLVVNDPLRHRKLIFETFKGRIETFRSGLKGPVDYIEGCA